MSNVDKTQEVLAALQKASKSVDANLKAAYDAARKPEGGGSGVKLSVGTYKGAFESASFITVEGVNKLILAFRIVEANTPDLTKQFADQVYKHWISFEGKAGNNGTIMYDGSTIKGMLDQLGEKPSGQGPYHDAALLVSRLEGTVWKLAAVAKGAYVNVYINDLVSSV